ncbi:hypothetical protein [Prochlorococcus marinus]|uniref:hypothetical protein n=1 Tax=Prochlorococcus marinus TaxID=1219 RepID=UPI0022B4482C|nr:hypothetical protein [Prochlorococcus marinus]
MRHLLLAPLIIGLSSPALADLGEAELTEFQTRTFDVWCGQRYKDCEVTFTGERLKVNAGKGITPSSILLTQEDNCGTFYYCARFTVTYQKANGSKANGKFLMQNHHTVREFRQELERFTGREIGAAKTIDIEETRNK